MKIHGVKLENFTLFDKLDAEFSPNVNLICGENSTGKTSLIKLLYACAKTCPIIGEVYRKVKVEQGDSSFTGFWYFSQYLSPKLQNVFMLDLDDAQRLVNLRANSHAKVSVDFGGQSPLQFFLEQGKRTYDLFLKKEEFQLPDVNFPIMDMLLISYIPSKEMISAVENFASLYDDYHIPFEETYYDLCLLLNRPRKRTLPPDMEAVVKKLETLIGGKVRQRGGVFYLDMENVGELPMGLVSEGYRKLATLLNLVETGTLADGAILFWDEPETNLNPRMAAPLVQAILTLAAAGVQVFITTHDYFIQQYFGLAAEYGDKFQSGAGKLDYRFMSLYRETNPDGAETIALESASRLPDLERNAVREEFDAVYDREQGLIYGD